jgi:hypothetical protein
MVKSINQFFTFLSTLIQQAGVCGKANFLVCTVASNFSTPWWVDSLPEELLSLSSSRFSGFEEAFFTDRLTLLYTSKARSINKSLNRAKPPAPIRFLM